MKINYPAKFQTLWADFALYDQLAHKPPKNRLFRQSQQKLRNELPRICRLLEPYKAGLKVVVESTFNWYWLIDGLQAEGFEVVLAHTFGLYLITGSLFCAAAGALHQQPTLRPQNNVKRDASRRARLAVWCSSLTRGNFRLGPLASCSQPAWFPPRGCWRN
jgi:hypothetical protein